MIELYDGDLVFLGPLDYVAKWGYEQKNNELSTATIELPADDAMCEKIVVPASWARLFDGDDDLGFYRFTAIPSEEHVPGGTIAYQLQSAECTLLDSMLTGWHELGGTGYSTRQVLEYILARQQTVRWVLGVCDFEDYYQYNFEDVTLLEAIMSLGEVVLGDYEFVFDSTTSPWTMHMLRPGSEAYCSLVYRRNMTAIRRSVDGRVVTRLYGRGYGEGDNQLTIASVNGGKDYIDADAAAIARWGIREGVHVDTRQTDPSTLMARMEQILAAGCSPAVSYEAEAIDLYRITGESWDNVRCGARVLVLDEALGAPVTVKVTSRKKDDVEGDPGRISYVLDNSRPDTAEELNEILDKIGVHELYSQGATNMYSMQLSDNADASHPLVMRFYVPGNVLRINSCLIYWQLEAFRTYATLAKSGGGSTKTSEVDGGATVTIPQTITTSDVFTSGPNSGREGSDIDRTSIMYDTSGGTSIELVTGAADGNTGSIGEQTTGAPQGASGAMLNTGSAQTDLSIGDHEGVTESTASGGTISENTAVSGYTAPGTDSQGYHSHEIGNHAHGAGETHRHTVNDTYTSYNSSGTTKYVQPSCSESGNHSHAVESHCHTMNHSHTISGTGHAHGINLSHEATDPGHSHSMGHWHLLDGHQHSLGGHTHSIPDHTHKFDHMHRVLVTVTIPAMSFELEPHSHSVKIPAHTHDLEYGVYEGDRAGSLSLVVDGEAVPADAIGDARELDIAKYLKKNDDGKVTRSAWHEVEFVPDGLTRITADLFFQVFIQSRGAGDY